MKIFIQWATDPKSSPEELDSSQWKNLPKRLEPDGTETIDNTKGWIQSLSVHGVTFKGDHCAIVENPQGFPVGSIKVIMWVDDQTDRIPDEMFARERVFQPMILRKGKWIPPQSEVIYITEVMKQDWEGRKILPIINNGITVPVKPFSDFIHPEDSLIRHGIWVSDNLNAEYEKEEMHSYRESI